jgi:hypothetical protein
MDSTLVAAGIALERGIKDFKNRYDTLIGDADYTAWCTKDTSDEKTLTNRIEKAVKILAG